MGTCGGSDHSAVYEGLPEILHTYVENGGRICVSSHSMRKTILRDYEAAGLPEPELIFDWACPEGKESRIHMHCRKRCAS